MLTRRRLLASTVAMSTLGACATASPVLPARGPGRGPWKISTPDAHGLSLGALQAASDSMGARGERQGLVVIRHGELVFERYWSNPWARAVPEWRNVSFSSGKSWGGAMIGRAVTLGHIDIDDLCSKYHPSDVSGLNPGTRIRHLLTMTSGGTMNMKPSSTRPRRLDDATPPGPGAEYSWYKEAEPGRPPGYGVSIAPGQRFIYDGAPADHLANIVSAAVGKSSHRFMMDDVVAPLGCENFAYQQEGIDLADNVRIGGSITLSCRDMARLGQLYLNRGRWAGQQLLDASYVRDSINPSAHNPSYGYLWWVNRAGRVPNAPRSMYFASGARGQFCFVLPEQDMVIATMGYGENQLSAPDAWTDLQATLPHNGQVT